MIPLQGTIREAASAARHWRGPCTSEPWQTAGQRQSALSKCGTPRQMVVTKSRALLTRRPATGTNTGHLFCSAGNPFAARYVPDTSLFLLSSMPVVAMEYIPQPSRKADLVQIGVMLRTHHDHLHGCARSPRRDVRRRSDGRLSHHRLGRTPVPRQFHSQWTSTRPSDLRARSLRGDLAHQ